MLASQPLTEHLTIKGISYDKVSSEFKKYEFFDKLYPFQR